jgi:hypothetical protein
VARRTLILALLLLAGCGGHKAAVVAEPVVPLADSEPVQAHALASLRVIRKDFAAHLVPNAAGVDVRHVRLRGPTLEAWSALPRTRAGMRTALALCNRMYRRYVVVPAGSLAAGQTAVYARDGVLLTASLRYKARCYALTKVAR